MNLGGMDLRGMDLKGWVWGIDLRHGFEGMELRMWN